MVFLVLSFTTWPYRNWFQGNLVLLFIGDDRFDLLNQI
ncbi:hypothetical protein SLEP1_g4528 [Rubroshorea leprosula]|uniref:Uncharacterized protein n=1 Tax=Rubroshorea leprosula TaxID=152421 RepID=A0AAV5HPF4_9ROSI|nr:hypothetical protein SLEP1_g4528 [Rubroshorea leprosula]